MPLRLSGKDMYMHQQLHIQRQHGRYDRFSDEYHSSLLVLLNQNQSCHSGYQYLKQDRQVPFYPVYTHPKSLVPQERLRQWLHHSCLMSSLACHSQYYRYMHFCTTYTANRRLMCFVRMPLLYHTLLLIPLVGLGYNSEWCVFSIRSLF